MEGILQKSGGGAASDECTATRAMILKGMTAITSDSEDEPVEGTLDVQSILSFKAAPYGAGKVAFTWQNPSKGAFSGVIIVGKTGSYPTGVSDGTRWYTGHGNNVTPGGISSATVGGFTGGTTYYFQAFSYAIKNGKEWLHRTSYTASANTAKSLYTYTSSGTFTVPDGVSKIDIFCVGGGGGGYGSRYLANQASGSGGGGGYTATKLGYAVTPGAKIGVTVGAGGRGGAAGSNSNGASGGSSSFGSIISASGGTGAGSAGSYRGGNGGSGGGAGQFTDNGTNKKGCNGGSNGGNGTAGHAAGGSGQGKTTRAFGDSSGTLYAGGGAGGMVGYNAWDAKYDAYGGSGGGGNCLRPGRGSAGAANTGGGGAGSGCDENSFDACPRWPGAAGGSGIVLIRI